MSTHIISRDRYSLTLQTIQKFSHIKTDRGLYLTKHTPDGKVYKAVVQWEEVQPHVNSEPTLVETTPLTMESDLERSILEIANTVQGTQQDPLTGELSATKSHLEDMRTLVFGEKGIAIDEITK